VGPVFDSLPSQSFTIHGLWPTAKATKTYGAFDYSIISSDKVLLDDMRNYWPPQSRSTGSPTFLWEHEWIDHGSDYAELILRVQPKRFAGLSGAALEKKLQSAFFHDVVAFYKGYIGAQKYPDDTFTKDSLARVFGIKSNQFTISCPSGFIVREIKICFDVTGTGHTVKTCANQGNTGCKKGTDFTLPAWTKSTQKRVIR
jgi:ribonuclease I